NDECPTNAPPMTKERHRAECLSFVIGGALVGHSSFAASGAFVICNPFLSSYPLQRTSHPEAPTMSDFTALDITCINTIRTLAMDAVQKANSGHPGAPMGLAPVAYTLWNRYLNYDPADPMWPNRDRFVLSNGHASMLLYSLIHLAQV